MKKLRVLQQYLEKKEILVHELLMLGDGCIYLHMRRYLSTQLREEMEKYFRCAIYDFYRPIDWENRPNGSFNEIKHWLVYDLDEEKWKEQEPWWK
jgi:hypothetical protein